MPDSTDHLAYRVRVLPSQLDKARQRVGRLEAEARQYRMFDLLPNEGKHNAQSPY